MEYWNRDQTLDVYVGKECVLLTNEKNPLEFESWSAEEGLTVGETYRIEKIVNKLKNFPKTQKMQELWIKVEGGKYFHPFSKFKEKNLLGQEQASDSIEIDETQQLL